MTESARARGSELSPCEVDDDSTAANVSRHGSVRLHIWGRPKSAHRQRHCERVPCKEREAPFVPGWNVEYGTESSGTVGSTRILFHCDTGVCVFNLFSRHLLSSHLISSPLRSSLVRCPVGRIEGVQILVRSTVWVASVL
ncbi:hypothetical protein MPTK1_3g05400 [Marchantia polymorpha subsp. ruderalis]|uniref:Uncharacterized protein n=2 Tax=Marchantia polymorpha TaxID=3197 RepID=A0AAF6AXP2_MARPO|nr:hypothetical protein MARPO_0006s0013 [Marchantia polymorpha]BBN04526.1 hypothetical protein Mp_3g05400 [Marchantia polymorpha subsp. ruderalis]|eukprot:PTQ47962.1 hypothetical protein MARPO_0006s0013 [Marchantia polymorpha]